MKQTAALAAAAATLLLTGAAQADPVPVAGAPPAMAPPTMAPSSMPPTAPVGRGGRPRGRFAMMDANGDGKVTQAEFVAYQDSLFDRIDTAHKGQIVKVDIDAAKTRLEAMEAGAMTRGAGGKGHRGEAAEKVLDRISERVGDNGVLTRAEWETMATRRFARMDVNHAGFLTADAFQRMGAEAGTPTEMSPGTPKP